MAFPQGVARDDRTLATLDSAEVTPLHYSRPPIMKIHPSARLLALALLLAGDLVTEAQQAQPRQRRQTDETTGSDREQRRLERRRDERQKFQQKFRQSKGGSQEDAEANYEEILIQLQEFATPFFPKKPRGPLQGAVNAAKNFLAGATLSFASFLGGVGVGYAQSGVLGMLAGSIVGSISACVISLGFGVKILYNLLFGLIATPAALDAAIQGKMWDEQRHEWLVYSLKEESQDLERKRQSAGGIRSSELYDILGVDPKASSREIKSAYRKKALLVHPDKNPDSETAEEEFLELFNAYNTLSDDQRRADYDRFGASADSTVLKAPFDAQVFFAVLLDADTVEPYIGELRVSFYLNKLQEMALLAQSLQDSDAAKQQELFTSMLMGWSDDSKRRYVDIAHHLLNFVEKTEDPNATDIEFVRKCRHEAERILGTVFGSKFLKILGTSLSREAELFLGYDFPWLALPRGVWTSATQVWDRNERRIRALNQFRHLAEEYNPDDSDNKKVFQLGEQQRELDLNSIRELLPDIVEFAWSLIEMDIASAIREASHRLFHDSVGRRLRRKRAKALRALGSAMLSVNKEQCVDEEFSRDAFQLRLDKAYRLAIMQQG